MVPKMLLLQLTLSSQTSAWLSSSWLSDRRGFWFLKKSLSHLAVERTTIIHQQLHANQSKNNQSSINHGISVNICCVVVAVAIVAALAVSLVWLSLLLDWSVSVSCHVAVAVDVATAVAVCCSGWHTWKDAAMTTFRSGPSWSSKALVWCGTIP